MASAGSSERIRSLLSSTFGVIVVVVSHVSVLSRLDCDQRDAWLICDSDTLAHAVRLPPKLPASSSDNHNAWTRNDAACSMLFVADDRLHCTNLFCTTMQACGACACGDVWFGIHLTMLNDGNACSRGTHEVKTWTTRGRLCAHHISHLYKLPTLSRPRWGTEKMLKDMATISVR